MRPSPLPRLLLTAWPLLAACAAGVPVLPASAPAPAAAPVVEVAVTVDDLPLHGPLPAGQDRVGLATRMLEVFRAHRLPPVHGFVNGARVEETPALEAVLVAWRAAGQRLGNHSFSHRNLDQTPLEDYLADVTLNEPLLERLEPDPAARHLYRYPFLHEGRDLETRRAVRRFLAAHGYTIAEVTIDADDWAFNPPWARCAARGDAAALARLREDFVSVHLEELSRMVALGQALAGRPPPQVLLLHLGVADVEALDALLTAYERAGVRWVGLPRALADPFYAEDPDRGFGAGAAFPYLLARARGLTVEPPIYARGLEERLEATCR